MTARARLTGGYLAAAGTVAIWTGFILVSRLGGKTALNAGDILALRLTTASLILLPFCRDIGWAHWRDARLWLLAALGGVLYGWLVYAGFKLAPAAHGAILLPGLQPFLVASVLWLLFRQRTARQRLFGLAFIALGLVCVAWPAVRAGSLSQAVLTGDALILASSAAWALYGVLARHWGFAPWLLTRFVAISSALLFLPIYLVFLPKNLALASPAMLWLQALYQGIGPTIIAMLLFLRAVAVLGAERVGACIALVPVLAGLAAAPLLGESFNAGLAAGLVLVSLGAFQATRPQTARRRSCPT